MRDLLASDDPESADLSVGAGIGRSAERNSTGPPILSACAKTGSAPMISHNRTACGLSEYRPHTGHDRVFFGKWRLVRPLDFRGFVP